MEDVRNGYVSSERARIDYGVAVDLERGTAVRVSPEPPFEGARS